MSQESLPTSSKDQSSEEQSQMPLSPEALDELQQGLDAKPWYKFWAAEYQTAKINVREAKTARGEVNRYERGQMYKVIEILREKIRNLAQKEEKLTEPQKDELAEARQLLKAVRLDINGMKKNMDTLEQQLEKRVFSIPIETEFGRFVIPVTELDLKRGPTPEGETETKEQDNRVPYIFWGGIRSNAAQNFGAIAAMALEGQRVYAIPHIEQADVEKPANIKELMAGQNSFKIQSAITRGVIRAMGFEKVNLMGYSTGANVVLEAAEEMSEDPESKDMIEDLIVIEPLGLEERSYTKLARQFGLQEGIVNLSMSREAGIKVMRQGSETNTSETMLAWQTVKTLAEKTQDAEKLSRIKVSGKFQWWIGGESPFQTADSMKLTKQVIVDTRKAMQRNGAATTPPDLCIVEDGTHSLLNMNAPGLARRFVEGNPEETGGKPYRIKRKDLSKSYMSHRLRDLKK